LSAEKAAQSDSENEESADDEVDKNEIDEILVGKGLGNCLKVLRARGFLGK